MFYSLIKRLFNFGFLFLLVVVWLYMDKLFKVPLQTVTEIFSVGFPWNLIILTAIIYFIIWVFANMTKLFRKRSNIRYVKRSFV